MKSCFAYIRVSTVKQGLHGVSLPEQRDAIAAYAARHQIKITRWFEERVTAAKRGRPVFSEMLKALDAGEASGLVVHKIDRSARNLKDWADLGQLIDRGISVHFVTDNLDLASRGGRLSADIQAVVAADYIRNLREEARKGIYGRLKQGFYPLRAPLGYLDCGKAKPKTPDPASAPLIRYAFEQYATGRHSLKTLKAKLTEKGLRNRGGRAISINGLSVILNNPFYHGEIRIRRTQQRFDGVHEPLISRTLFNRVRDVLHGKAQRTVQKHSFVFARLITCASCGYSLIGESRKGHVYYRCHTPICPTTSLREERIDEVFRATFSTVQPTPEFIALLEAEARSLRTNWHALEAQRRDHAGMQLQQIKHRLERLTDAYLDNLIDKTAFEERRLALVAMQKDMAFREAQQSADPAATYDRFHEFLGLASSLSLSHELAVGADKRDLVQTVTSDRRAERKNLSITLQKPFQVLVETMSGPCGGPHRDVPRTVQLLLAAMAEWPMMPSATGQPGCPSKRSRSMTSISD